MKASALALTTHPFLRQLSPHKSLTLLYKAMMLTVPPCGKKTLLVFV